MAIEYSDALSLTEKGLRYTYTDRDAMLYAIAIGMGSEPPNPQGSRYGNELPFVFERDLRVVPTFASVIAWGAGVSVGKLGLDPKGVLHGEEETIFHRPLAPSGSVLADSGVVEIYDRGKDRGAIVLRQTVLRSEGDGEPVVTIKRTLFARRNGGEGGATSEAPRPHPVPVRPPDIALRYATMPNQAILYRLCGDRTLLHVDPAAASAAGFDRPILHGLCTYGICCRAVLEAYCGYDPGRIANHAVRFSSPVFPGDILEVKLWRDGDIVAFEAEVPERNVTVIKNGRTILR
jgi:acyl dehydratase